MKKYALFGKTVDKSLSPLIHYAIAEYYSVDLEYELVNCDTVEEIIEYLNSGKYIGGNVTMPFKVQMMDKIDRAMPSADSAGSLNTIKVTKDGIWGYNTDYKGFLDVLNIHNYSLKGRNVLVYGTGGAARAIVNAVILADANTIILDGRSPESKFKLYEEFSELADNKMTVIYGSHGLVSDLVVNASSLGSYLNSGMSINLDLMDTKAVFDIVYNPNETELIKRAKEKSLKYFTGTEMLICQAIRSFYVWHSDLNREKIDFDLYNFIKDKLIRVMDIKF